MWTATIHTSDILSAGTDSKVYLILYGDGGKSDVVSLHNKSDNFERASVDIFNVDVKDVGKPYKIIIGHDNSHLYSDWHLDRVTHFDSHPIYRSAGPPKTLSQKPIVVMMGQPYPRCM